MELQPVIESAMTCRYFRLDPVPDEVLTSALDAARFAPTGANLQGVRFVVVRDEVTRKTLADWYLELWNASMAAVREQGGLPSVLPKAMADADHFANHLAEVPVLVVVCAAVDALLITDADLGRPSIVGGASVYPAVQNLLLKCRELGLGAALTTNLCRREHDVKELLDIPDGIVTAATIAVGFPAAPFPRRLTRRPLEELAFADRYGRPLLPRAPEAMHVL